MGYNLNQRGCSRVHAERCEPTESSRNVNYMESVNHLESEEDDLTSRKLLGPHGQCQMPADEVSASPHTHTQKKGRELCKQRTHILFVGIMGGDRLGNVHSLLSFVCVNYYCC